jgi:hypothetical protein
MSTPLHEVDRQLLFDVRQVMSGANIHQAKTLIFAYEQAIELCNAGRVDYRHMPDHLEQQLRRFVRTWSRASRMVGSLPFE